MSNGTAGRDGNTVESMGIEKKQDSPRPEPDDEVPVRTRRWCSFVMIPVAAMFSLAQCSYATTEYMDHPQGAMYPWMMLSTLLTLVLPFVLVMRGPASRTGVLGRMRDRDGLSVRFDARAHGDDLVAGTAILTHAHDTRHHGGRVRKRVGAAA